MARIHSLLFHNFGTKVLSIVIAALLWWAVARDPRVEVVLTVPIEFHHVPPELEINSEKVPQAEIRLRGPARIVRALSSADVHPIIDLAGAGIGEKTFDLTPQQIRLPHDVDVEQIVPSQFRVSFDRRVSREVEVKPRVIGTFASGYRISEAIPVPNMITIIGPEARINAIESAITDPVDASGVIGRATFSTNAYIPDPLVRIAKPTAIHVTVITERSSARAGVP